MLDDEVIKAVRAGQFHIWSVSHVDQGVEILTGVPAGELQEDGSYPEGTVNFLVNERLKSMVESLRKLAKTEEKNNNEVALPAKSEG
jgi:hypothetical protein